MVIGAEVNTPSAASPAAGPAVLRVSFPPMRNLPLVPAAAPESSKLVVNTASRDCAGLIMLINLTLVDDSIAVAFAGVAVCNPVTEHTAGCPPVTVAPTAVVVATSVSDELPTVTLSVTAKRVNGIR